MDVFVVNVFPCHVIHDEEIKVWTGKLVAATELESVYFLGVKAMPFNIYPPLPPPHSVQPWKIIFLVGVAALALLIYGVFLSPGVWGKNLDLTIPVGGGDWASSDRKC